MDDGNRITGIDGTLQRAEAHFYQGSFQHCYELTSKCVTESRITSERWHFCINIIY